jgi:hypothetical protein
MIDLLKFITCLNLLKSQSIDQKGQQSNLKLK